jgi:hypothetical protein
MHSDTHQADVEFPEGKVTRRRHHCQQYQQWQAIKVWQAYPVLQVPKVGWALTQAAAALLKGVAAVLHAPQLAISVFRFASQPLLATPSQLPNLQEQAVLCAVHMLLPSCSMCGK